jgi:hypothetical protein
LSVARRGGASSSVLRLITRGFDPGGDVLSVQEHRSIKIRTFRKERSLKDNICSMYGEYCAMKIVKDYINHCHKGKTT